MIKITRHGGTFMVFFFCYNVLFEYGMLSDWNNSKNVDHVKCLWNFLLWQLLSVLHKGTLKALTIVFDIKISTLSCMTTYYWINIISHTQKKIHKYFNFNIKTNTFQVSSLQCDCEIGFPNTIFFCWKIIEHK